MSDEDRDAQGSPDERLLEEIRKRYDYASEAWRSIRDEAAQDMKFLENDPWPDEERRARKDAHRPCLSLDELNQYVNQRVNDVRQNKRAIKLTPEGDGADDKTAMLRANKIREIESRNGQAAYTTAFQDALERSYGFFRISKEYESENSFNQELRIVRIPNPDTVLIDPDYKEADASDVRYAFVLEDIPYESFQARWPNAERVNFDGDLKTAYPKWLKEGGLQVAEYWKLKTQKDTLLALQRPDSPQAAPVFKFKSEMPEGSKLEGNMLVIPGMPPIPVARTRKADRRSVVQYITNGIEILETNAWEGKYIPIVQVPGKESWVDKGTGSKRVLKSLIRHARDAQLLFCYYKTAEAELIAQVPKTPWVLYEGQIEGHEAEWQHANTSPIPYLQVKAQTSGTGDQVLPLPQRQVFEPPIQAYEIGAESAKRSIQSAMGMYNTSVGKHDTQAKSGIAIKELDVQSDQGNFHFIDNYDRALVYAGRILDDLIPYVYDTERDTGIMMADEQHKKIKINAPYTDEKGEPQLHDMKRGRHGAMVSTGPSYQSQRDEAADFANTLAGIPEIFPRIADLVVRLRNLGPIGDKIAERLTPPEFAEQKEGEQQKGQQAQAKLQQAMGMVEAMTQQLNALTQEKESKTAEIESKERIAQLQSSTQIEVERMKLAASNDIQSVKNDLAQLQMQIKASMEGRQLDMQAQQAQAAQDLETQRAEREHQLAADGLAQTGQLKQGELDQKRKQSEASLALQREQAQQNFALQQQQAEQAAAQQAQGAQQE